MGAGASVNPKPVPEWTAEEVKAYLESEDLPGAAACIESHGVDGARLTELDDAELESLGVAPEDRPGVLRLLRDLRLTLCLKQGAMEVKGGMLSSWSPRYAVLSGVDFKLYESAARAELKGTYTFDATYSVIRDYFSSDGHRVLLRWGDDEELHLQMPMAADADAWCEALRTSVMQQVSRVGDDGLQTLVKFIQASSSPPGADDVEEKEPEENLMGTVPASQIPVPQLQIVCLVVGTRGDVQPFMALAKRLQSYGHRVRIGTHAIYRDFVTGQGIEFYPLGGDPKKLSEHMTKTNGRLMPNLTDREEMSEISGKMSMLAEITESTWPACTQPDPGLPLEEQRPFVADAIISNPVTYGHIHVAEALSCPLTLMFPQPWLSTRAFPHPLASMSYTDGWSYKNFLSYEAIDSLMFNSLSGIINGFRKNTLGLDIIRAGDNGGSLIADLKVPFFKLWSPNLSPKPADWGPEVEVVGGLYLDLASSYDPPQDLVDFLEAGEPPIFVGFGSVIIKDTAAVTRTILEAAANTGARVLIQSSWSDMGDMSDLPANVKVIGNCPHDWLFQRMGGVMHHGGAGTVAAGLRAGCPTVVVPFFGDQCFWAEMVARKMGTPALPFADFSVERLSEAFTALRSEEVRANATRLAELINAEDGVSTCMEAFHRHLPVEDMVCDVSVFTEKTLVARVYCADCRLKLSPEADVVIHADPARAGHHREPYRYVDWGVSGASNVATGALQGAANLGHEVVGAVTDLVAAPIRGAAAGGVMGFARGLASGIGGLVKRPLRGAVVILDTIATGAANQANAAVAAVSGRKVKPRRNVFLHSESTFQHLKITLSAVSEQDRAALLRGYEDALKAQRVFDDVDTNDNNAIEKHELFAHLATLGIDRDAAEAAMQVIDSSGDGEVNFAEFSVLFKDMASDLRRLVATPLPSARPGVTPPPSGPMEKTAVVVAPEGVEAGLVGALATEMHRRAQRLVGIAMSAFSLSGSQDEARAAALADGGGVAAGFEGPSAAAMGQEVAQALNKGHGGTVVWASADGEAGEAEVGSLFSS